MVSSHQSDMISSCSHLARSVSRICEGAALSTDDVREKSDLFPDADVNSMNVSEGWDRR